MAGIVPFPPKDSHPGFDGGPKVDGKFGPKEPTKMKPCALGRLTEVRLPVAPVAPVAGLAPVPPL